MEILVIVKICVVLKKLHENAPFLRHKIKQFSWEIAQWGPSLNSIIIIIISLTSKINQGYGRLLPNSIR